MTDQRLTDEAFWDAFWEGTSVPTRVDEHVQWQFALARKQLEEIRNLRRDAIRNVEWTKPLTPPALILSGMLLLTFVVMLWK